MMLSVLAITCLIGPVECQIKKNNPTLSDEYVRYVSDAVYEASRVYNIPAKVYTAILMQESAYNFKAKRCDKYSCDYGMSQISDSTADAYNMDKERLLSDVRYSINMGAKVLAWFRKTYEVRENKRWWVRYNVGTAKNAINWKAGREYYRKVKRWM